MKGWILDITPDYRHNVVWIWIKGVDGVVRKTKASYRPTLYVRAPSSVMRKLRHTYEQDDGIAVAHCHKHLSPGRKKEAVLGFTVNRYARMHPLGREIDGLLPPGGRVFNVDVDIGLACQTHRTIFPLALVDVAGLHAYDHRTRLYYDLPPLSITHVDAVWQGRKIDHLVVNGEPISNTPPAMIEQLQDIVNHDNPDIILTNGGDTFFPILYAWAADHGIKFVLGRAPEQQPFAPERTYHSYGRVVYTPSKCLLTGRLHLDRQHSFFYREGGMAGLFDIARLCRIPPQKLSRVTPGTAITAMQVAWALQHDILIPWKKNVPEALKSAYALFMADRGGIIYEPQVGIHENVYEIDFSCMYPFIMMNHNISPETVLCDCCSDSPYRVPVLNYHLCQEKRGLIPIVLKPLVRRRIIYKQHLRKQNIPIYQQRSTALKWVLVTCFGYTGYRNARFGRIECHEAINAFARQLMIQAARIAEEHGFHILHGIVDSLWLHGKGNIEHVCHQITQETGIPMDCSGRYRWIVFLPTKNNKAGALNHYYGVLDTGSVKVRGLEVRRRDTPDVVRRCQEDMLITLAQANDIDTFDCHIRQSLAVLKEYVKRVRTGTCKQQDLLITHRVTKPLSAYRQRTNSVACLSQLHQQGIKVQPGQNIQYVIADSTANRPEKKVNILPLNRNTYDREKYVIMLCRAAESLLLPFGYTEERVKRLVDGVVPLTAFQKKG